MAAQRFSLKDQLFNQETVSYLGVLLASGIPDFDRAGFESAVAPQLADLELKERIAFIAEILTDHLDPNFEVAAKQLRSSLPPPLDPNLTDDDFGDFILAPFGKYVEDHGLNHYAVSMNLLRDITMRFSMEGSVRPFINAQPENTLELFTEWAHDDNYHVRRLVSEGTRPRLPWAPRIDMDVSAPLPLLDQLHADPTRYVTRSVANHLNDISKVEPDLVFAALRRWHDEARQDPTELEWMTRHSLRTLVKKGDHRAMELLGYSPKHDVSARIVEITPYVRAGEALEFEVELSGRPEERLLIDYAIEFVRKDGGTRPKVFKLKQLAIPTEGTTTLTKRHPLRANATTYSLYSGRHALTVVVNGKEVARSEFEITVD